MALYYGCEIPEDLYYHPEIDFWMRFESNSSAAMGMTDIAQTLAGKLLSIRFKSVGKEVKSGRSAATIESSKWVGPFVVPFDAEIVETNEPAFSEDVLIANKDPYGRGWLVRVHMSQPEAVRSMLITGQEAVSHFQKKIEENDIRCFRCAEDEEFAV
ncbi:MAG: glycine cleavage system protein H [Anaerolineales bacterium]